MSKEIENQTTRQLFDQIDTDKDGLVNRKEILRALEDRHSHAMVYNENQVKGFFSRFRWRS